MMTKFGKCAKPFSGNKVVSKIVSTRIVISNMQLAKLIKIVNKKKSTWGVCKFYLIAQNS